MATTMAPPYDETIAIELSNRGAELLQRGKYDEAAALLMDAVRQFRVGNELLVNIQDSPVQHIRKVPECTKRRRAGTEFIYSSPIFLSTSEGSQIAPILVRLSIVFNFAISRHLRSLDLEGAKRENKLRTTLKLYNWVLSMERSLKEEESPLGVLPFLGLINNCAQIHRYLRKEEKANKIFEILLSSLMLLKDKGDLVIPDELDGFFSSTSHLILKRPGVARAA